MKKEFIIDGANFKNKREFYEEVQNVFTKNLDWKIGDNLDAFSDVSLGGFGMHEDEPIKIVWKNFQISRKNLGERFINQVIEVINYKYDYDCELEIIE